MHYRKLKGKSFNTEEKTPDSCSDETRGAFPTGLLSNIVSKSGLPTPCCMTEVPAPLCIAPGPRGPSGPLASLGHSLFSARDSECKDKKIRKGIFLFSFCFHIMTYRI